MLLVSKKSIVKILRIIRKLRKINSRTIEKFLLTVIIINSITLGLETDKELFENYKEYFNYINNIALLIFSVEIISKIMLSRGRYFKNPWNVFDFIIITASIPTLFPTLDLSNLTILRSLRLLRIFLIISLWPKVRIIVESLLNSLPGIFGITVLLILVFYVFGVMATQLFGNFSPDNFGDLGKSLFTLFQIMTLDNWSTIIRPIIQVEAGKHAIAAYLFFIPFVLLSAYIILNIFIAIIVNSMREARERSEERERKADAKERKAELALAFNAEEKRDEYIFHTLLNKMNDLEKRFIYLERKIENDKNKTR